MKNSLLGLIGAGITSLAGCAQNGLITEPTYSDKSISYSTPTNIQGNGLGLYSNDNNNYKLERIVINRTAYDLNRNLAPDAGERSFYFIRPENSHLLFDADKGTLNAISSDGVYIPGKVLTEDGKIAHRITLRTTGPYAVKARLKNPDTKNVQLGILRENPANLDLNLEKIKIDGTEYFTPAVEYTDSTKADKALNFYMVPVEGTVIDIERTTGAVTLINQDGILRPYKLDNDALEIRLTRKSEENRRMIEKEKRRLQNILAEQLEEERANQPKAGQAELIEN